MKRTHRQNSNWIKMQCCTLAVAMFNCKAGYVYLWHVQHTSAISLQWKHRNVQVVKKRLQMEGEKNINHKQVDQRWKHAVSCEEAWNTSRLQQSTASVSCFRYTYQPRYYTHSHCMFRILTVAVILLLIKDSTKSLQQQHDGTHRWVTYTCNSMPTEAKWRKMKENINSHKAKQPNGVHSNVEITVMLWVSRLYILIYTKHSLDSHYNPWCPVEVFTIWDSPITVN